MKIKMRIIGLHFKRTRTKIMVIQKTKTKYTLKFWQRKRMKTRIISVTYEKSWKQYFVFILVSQKIKPLTFRFTVGQQVTQYHGWQK